VSIDGVYHLPCYDHNGNITAYISENGTLSAQYLYDVFGNAIEQSGPLAETFRHRFSTKCFIPETQSYYYGYRHYAPNFGCWLSRDPIGERGGLSLHGFVRNNPVSLSDKLGLFIIRPVAGSPRVQTNTDGSFGGAWASVVILPDEGSAFSGTVLHMKHTEIHVTDCQGNVIADSVQTVQKRIPTNGRAGWELKDFRSAPIYSNVADVKGYGKCAKGRIIIKASWYHIADLSGLPPLGTPTSDDISGSKDAEETHGGVGSTAGWPLVPSGSYADFDSLSVETTLNCSSPFYDIHASGRGLDSTHWEYRRGRGADEDGSRELRI
jgi:RHS repeat-associated protein